METHSKKRKTKMSKPSIAVAYSMKKKKKAGEAEKLAHGGKVYHHPKGVHSEIRKGESMPGALSRGGHNDIAKALHKTKLDEIREMPSPTMKAEGGEVKQSQEQSNFQFARDKDKESNDYNSPPLNAAAQGPGYAKGGSVACMNCGHVADEKPNDFDYVESNDLVSRAMANIKKK